MVSMKPFAVVLISSLLSWPVPSASQGEVPASTPAVHVGYEQPEKFTDAGDRYFSSDKMRAAYLEQLSKHLVRRATHLLPARQTLTVIITEVDMAGNFEPCGDT
jgi:hypothetical protein